MYNFRDIVGQEEVKEHLQNAIALNKVSHAYVFVGDEGCGKKMMARTFAKTLLCKKHGKNACDVCSSCIQVNTNNHPDVKTLIKSKQTPTIGDIRTQVISDAQIKPYESDKKVYIIPEAHLLRDDAQNALLKTIEEPPEYVVVILLTNNIDSLLPTILSRCVTLNFKAIDKEKIVSYLMANCGMPDYAASINAAFANGKIGLAIKYSTMEEFVAIKEDVIRFMENIDRQSVFNVLNNVSKVVEYKEYVQDYIDLILWWFRDMLIVKSSLNKELILFKQEMDVLVRQAEIRSYEMINDVIEEIELAKKRLKSNVNVEVVMEMLFVALKKNTLNDKY